MINIFSANSLKILESSKEKFEQKYVLGLDLVEYKKETELGNKLHTLICYLLRGYSTEKFECALNFEEIQIWEKIKSSEIINFALSGKEKFIEQPFFIKDNLGNFTFYLTGRFDAVIKNDDKLTILDWKTKTLPKNPNTDIQTIVYMYCATKLFKSKNLEMVYYSLQEGDKKTVLYEKREDIIYKTISKLIQ